MNNTEDMLPEKIAFIQLKMVAASYFLILSVLYKFGGQHRRHFLFVVFVYKFHIPVCCFYTLVAYSSTPRVFVAPE